MAAHYGRGDVLSRMLSVVQAAGRDPESFSPEVLSAADQLHIGGPEATTRVAERAGIRSGMHVLDIGSGLGGVSRHLQARLGARVTGIDLTPQFVRAAQELTRRTGQSGSVTFTNGSAVRLPFGEDVFDAAVLIHVGMNIPDKAAVFAEAARVLRSGGVLAVYEIMRVGDGSESYPLPWAATPQTSALWSPTAYAEAIRSAGFAVDSDVDVTDAGIAFVEQALASGAPTGLEAPVLRNLLDAFQSRTLAPVEIYARLR